jgi:hypothetical protein
MTKRDFIAIADGIRKHNKENPSIAFTNPQISTIADILQDSNPRFDREFWIDYVHDSNAKTPCYMLVLNGDNDHSIKIVDKETWDWIMNPHTQCPPAVLERIRVENFDEELKVEDCISEYTAVNDAALLAPVIPIQEGYFDRMKDALDFIKKNNIEIEDTFEGHIY